MVSRGAKGDLKSLSISLYERERLWEEDSKGDTPLYPRSSGIAPLWTPPNGVKDNFR